MTPRAREPGTVDSSRLSSRLREILRGQQPGGGEPPRGDTPDQPEIARPEGRHLEPEPTIADAIGASQVHGPCGTCLVVEREYRAHAWHGARSVADYEAAIEAHLEVTGDLGPGLSDVSRARPERLLFLDTETTGLGGGAGTYAFLVGYGCFDQGAFRTRQFFLPDYDHEEAMLASVADLASSADALVTYNGRAFDLPLLEMRYRIHRQELPFAGRPHLDMLHPARRLWRGRGRRAHEGGGWHERAAGPGLDETSCALAALERRVLGFERVGDVPGFEIPARYFRFVRSGDASLLTDVFEHNRLDLLSLAALTATVLRMVALGPEAATSAGDCLALGRLYEQAGRFGDAEGCYRQAAALGEGSGWPADADPGVHLEALWRLARRLRRDRRHVEAAEAWRRLLDLGGPQAPLGFEAAEALAVHFEHRARDLAQARAFALRALDGAADRTRQREVQHRLERLARKAGTALDWDTRD